MNLTEDFRQFSIPTQGQLKGNFEIPNFVNNFALKQRNMVQNGKGNGSGLENGVWEQNGRNESRFVNLGPDFLKFAKSELDLLEFLLSVTQNIKCCCFWRFWSKLAVSDSCRVKFLRQRTLGDEDTAD